MNQEKDFSSVVEHVPNMCKVLNLISSFQKKNRWGSEYIYLKSHFIVYFKHIYINLIQQIITHNVWIPVEGLQGCWWETNIKMIKIH